MNELNNELSCKNKELLGTKKVMEEQKFYIVDRFKHNTTTFKSFDIFKAVLDYLHPLFTGGRILT